MKLNSLAIRNMKELYRDPVTILLGLAMPVLFLFLFHTMYLRIELEFFSPSVLTPGIIIFSYSFLIMFSAMLIAKDRQIAFLSRLFAAPLRASDFILGYLLPFIPIALLQTIICLAVGTILGANFSNLWLSAMLMFITAMNCVSIGMLLGSLFTVNQVSGIGSLLITMVSIFSGAWIDLEMIGGVFRKIGYALPFAHAIDGVRMLFKGNPYSSVAGHANWVYVYAVVFFILAIAAFRSRMKE